MIVLSRSIPDFLHIRAMAPRPAHEVPLHMIVLAGGAAKSLTWWAARMALEIVPEAAAEGGNVSDAGWSVDEPLLHGPILLANAAVSVDTGR